jgi:SARP family transcriptional regulator, regulator of embCAB operon
MTARTLLTAQFFGTFRVSVEGIPVDTVSSRPARNVLAYLLAHRRTAVPRDVLMDVFWPAAGPGAARNSLHVALSRARQALRAASPAAMVERRFDTYRIAGPVTVWTDLEHFERACATGRRIDRAGDATAAIRSYETACQIYEGDFLADEPYAEWAASTRDALRLQAVDVQSRLVEMYIECGSYGPAALVGRRILAVDPCNEAVHRRLMVCYAAAGMRHLALAQYDRLTTALWDTFRVRPSAETIDLYERLRRRCRPERRSA